MMGKKTLYTAMIATLCATPFYFSSSKVFADEKEQEQSVIFITEQSYTDDYQYAHEARKATTSIMLFGVTDVQKDKSTNIPHYTPDLPQFIDSHLKSAKNGLLSNLQDEDFDVYAGDSSFFSEDMNRGVSTKSAKLVGLAMDFGRWTVGGGYTWDEENPAFLNENEEGFILGSSYRKNDWAIQASYMATGDAFSFGGGDKYSSYILGASYAPSSGVGYTATVQFQQYDGDKTYIDDNEVRFTIGTKIKF